MKSGDEVPIGLQSPRERRRAVQVAGGDWSRLPGRGGDLEGNVGSRSGARRRVRSAQVLASAILAIALLALTGVAMWSAFATSGAAEASDRAGTLAASYTSARFAASTEQSLERQYQLEPSPQVRRAHLVAKNNVDTAMAAVARQGGAADRAVAAEILSRNASALVAADQVFLATDQHLTAAAAVLNQFDLDLVFTAMQDIVNAQADQHDKAALAANQTLLHIELVARWATSLAVGVGALLVLLFSRLRRRYTRENAVQARLNAHQASHDGLTGLPNRMLFARLLDEQLASAQSHGGSVGVLLLDLDRFKEINDTLGHHYGDRLLQQVGPRIRGVLRLGEVMARLGGDEFALLMPTMSTGEHAIAELQAITRRALAALREPFVVDEVALSVDASAGIAVSPEHGDTGELLLQRADIAMYLAKSKHLDIAVYDSTLDDYNPRKLALLSRLRAAVGQGELVLHYQPLIDVETSQVRGAEALVRWQHPEEGLLPPSEFVPLAEGSGFIHELTRHVLQTACAQAEMWQRAGQPLVVSVNISARCLLDISLPETVAAALTQARLPARLLKLEITESAIIADPGRAQNVINRLHALGVALSIDDFGTGYSSLSYLRALPVRELKIDRSFVTRMLSEPKDAVIVRTGVELAQRLGLESVAEGVEDADTLAALSALGCTTAQGFHIGRPMRADGFHTWMAVWASEHSSLPDEPGALVADFRRAS